MTRWRACQVIALVGAVGFACSAQPEDITFDETLDRTPTTRARDAATTATTQAATHSNTTTPVSVSTDENVDGPDGDSPAPSTISTSTTPIAAPPSAPVGPPSAIELDPLITWRGTSVYLHGANLPWVRFGCDFGCGTDGGMSSMASTLVAAGAILDAADAGMTHIRWWLFPRPEAAFVLDDDAVPLGLRPEVFDDIDAALEIVERADVDVVFTLFAGPNLIPPEWLTEPATRAALVDVLSLLFARYAGHPRIMTWQVMNEPEWEIWAGRASASAVQSLVRDVASAVHRTTDALVSVGAARLDGLELWTDVGLDYLTVHWYDPMRRANQCAPCADALEVRRALGTELPILIGEFPLIGDDRLARLQLFRDQGYAGALAWSLLPDRTNDRIAVDLDASARFDPDAPLATGSDPTASVPP